MRKIGKYEIAEKIGVGGFGEVYKGHDPFIKRNVAIKTCQADDSEVRTRFFQEAEIAGNLHHRNITTVYDFGLHESLPFLVQEYLSGEDLDRKIKRRDYLPYPEKLYYLLQIARGLAYAHSQGVIHRDIKPGNVRILEDGTAKIMDFGIAKLAQQATGPTQTGMTVGTAAYLAPEQIRGEPVSRATDVFSFGVLAYELLTYERPFKGEQISAVLYQTLHEEPPRIDTVWPAAPADLVTLVHRSLSKKVAERQVDGAELLRELEQVQRRGRTDGEGDRTDSGSMVTAPIVTKPPPPPPPSVRPAQPPPPAPVSASHALDQIELTSVATQITPEKRAASVSVALPAKRAGSPWPKLIAVGALLIAVGLGWWLGQDRKPVAPPPPAPTTTDVPPAKASTAPPPTVAVAPPPAAVTPPPPPAAPVPAPPPVVTSGTVSVAALPWSRTASVEIGGTRYRLDQVQTVELPAGAHTAIFRISDPGYSSRATRSVTVEAGKTAALAPPFAPPGAISVRPFPQRLPGQVILDGSLVGQTPLSRMPLGPGKVTLEVRPLAGTAGPLSREVEVRSGQETVISFDLAAGRMEENVKPLG